MKILFKSVELDLFLEIIFKYYKKIYSDITIKAIKSADNHRPYPEIRAFFCIFAYRKFKRKFKRKYSQPQIAGVINKSHSNFRHYKKNINNLYETDKFFKENYDKLEKLLDL